ISVTGTGCFPNPRRPRTLWVGIAKGADELKQVHDAIEAPLLDMGNYRRETRGYTPHVTLGRVKGDNTSHPLPKTVAKHKTWSGGETMVTEVNVMSSELRSDGPIYTVLGRAKLAK